ncbi:bifunctional 23S rRNA (guanine(2069)-N(7))-methyltransferase RlmK/23S rRNA (guanine(2445)-N(2))-methyltransferase RlmL [Solimonas marina]|uniref:Ribosomal RNA large subunit methyltransferase K/L n=1 Tax=Solimonas marina TaxID=2714601 RepID=A0A970B7Z4_9GAMM|nr:bifunctional 23S rRNA (guanine(2069)-N(7))-methyltransferase RlmK/23S rRNA (guanine(2445)-N(2))-methyltransferase RlmL [Solimonas marina]NKF21744.1 bifunctional 23S rRNA (guanine(2069)-N(7))-methyltransferase RlmK/23S rRNA (guanine(2445)-N(2))-methyltransferase RlmL [Solimonas marina]
MEAFPLFVTCPRGVEPLLVAELSAIGALDAKEARGGVACRATTETAYRACLWSRLASRVLLPLQRFELSDAQSIYDAAQTVVWPDLFASQSRFAIEVAGRTPGIANTHFAGLRLKDAIVDGFRAAGHERPDVDTEYPDIRLHLHLDREHGTLSLDLAGESLHRRGYRARGVEAPLKENLAAAILVRAGWPELMAGDAPLVDPMCGSGTLLIEGLWMAADIAPGILRRRWGFEAWLDHQPATWKRVRAEASERRDVGLAQLGVRAFGRDLEPRAIQAARANAERAGLAGKIQLEVGDAIAVRPLDPTPGVIVTNPPYGERLATDAELVKLYSLLGVTLAQHFRGWQFGFFTARDDLAPRLGLRASKISSLYNGAIACKMLRFEIPGATPAPRASDDAARPASAAGDATTAVPELAEDFANRLRKNLRHLGKWAKRGGVNAWRVYDADLPEYAVAVDVYDTADGERHAHVQEYAAPKTVDPARAEKRLRGALAGIASVLELPPARLHYKLRQSQKGTSQYQRQGDAEQMHVVVEHGCKLYVNFDDYLDTGVFLDHRPIRQRIGAEAAGKRMLNLFCYTGVASVHAAVGGAAQTVSVDMSNTYLDWAQRNLLLNGQHSQLYERPPLPGTRLVKHALVRADCMVWLEAQAKLPSPPQFDLIFLDPPTFSNSKKMEGTLDIQRDHGRMIRDTMTLLAPGGTLYFSTNRRGFKLDTLIESQFAAQDITAQTLAEDFKRPPPAHKCWAIQRRSGGLPVSRSAAIAGDDED